MGAGAINGYGGKAAHADCVRSKPAGMAVQRFQHIVKDADGWWTRSFCQAASRMSAGG